MTTPHPSTMKRAALGFVLRLAGAVGISLFVWWLAITPFARLPVSREADENLTPPPLRGSLGAYGGHVMSDEYELADGPDDLEDPDRRKR